MRDRHLLARETCQMVWGGLGPGFGCVCFVLKIFQYLTISSENFIASQEKFFCDAFGVVALPIAVKDQDQLINNFNSTGLKINNRMIFNGSRH